MLRFSEVLSETMLTCIFDLVGRSSPTHTETDDIDPVKMKVFVGRTLKGLPVTACPLSKMDMFEIG